MTHVTALTTIPAIIWWLLGGLAATCTITTVSACILAGRCDQRMYRSAITEKETHL